MTIVFILMNVLTSCGRTQNKRTEQIIKSKSNIRLDTSKTTIIPFDQKGDYPFDKSFKPSTLSQNEINIIDSLLIASVSNYNNSLDKNHKEFSINFKKYNYRKQLIAVTNKRGQKEIWVNCFCDTWHSNRWKSEIMIVDDGGRCYFNFKINLATKKFYEFRVNGLG